MNALLALLLKDRISQFAYVDRLAGMVRLVKYERSGGVIAIPVAIDAEADLACDDSQQPNLVIRVAGRDVVTQQKMDGNDKNRPGWFRLSDDEVRLLAEQSGVRLGRYINGFLN